MMRSVFRAAVTTGGGAMVAMALAVASVKIISVLAGPAGVGLYALILQLQTAVSAISTFGGGGGIAMVQGIASRSGEERARYIKTSGVMFVAAAAVALTILLAGAPWLLRLFENADAFLDSSLVRTLSLPVVFGTLAVFFSGVLNGYRAIGALAAVKILGSLATLALIVPAARVVLLGSAAGFVLAVTASTGVQATASMLVIARRGWLRDLPWRAGPLLDRASLRHFLSLAGASLLTGQVVQGGLLLLNAQVLAHFGLSGAGLFTAAWSLSMTHVTLILLSFSTYYLPTLAGAGEGEEARGLIGTVLRLSTLSAVPLIAMLVVLKPVVLSLLYAPEFFEAHRLMRWMLIGDYVKITSWVFATTVTARADMRTFLAAELAWFLSLLGGSVLLMRGLGSLEAVGIVFCAVYVGHLAYHLHYVRTRWGFRPSREDVGAWLLGFGFVLIASVLHWDAPPIHWPEAAMWIVASVLVSWIVLGPTRRRLVLDGLRARLGGGRD